MRRYRHPRADALRGGPSARHVEMPLSERLLQALGAHPSFAESVLGDLAEERARVAEEAGEAAARWWYLGEGMRSAPHLLWNALRHGGVRGRARAGAVLGVLALILTLVAVAVARRDGPPARLVVEGQGGRPVAEGLVVNTRHPVRLAVRVFDAKGRALPSTEVRYRWMAGLPVRVTPTGVVTCQRAGDASVRAAAGGVATTVQLHCRPVKRVVMTWGMSLAVGDSGEHLRFMALAPDGAREELIAGEVQVEDSSVATLRGTRVVPLAPGRTVVSVRIGDGEAGVGVQVFERVPSFAGLREDQRYVLAPVRLAPGDTIRWPLPLGLFWLEYGGRHTRDPAPAFDVTGLIMCMPALAPGVEHTGCLARAPGATLRIAHPGTTSRELVGSLALTKQETP